MAFYTTPPSRLATNDLRELLDDGAVENARLEFKLRVPNKEQSLKKLSSFANTFGGMMVVGAEEKDSRIIGLPGVDPEPGYKQRVVDWCAAAVDPPLYVEVSNPIPTPEGTGKVCYVIRVPESETAPHFLNGRNGLWVRTDEFSRKFDAKLATEAEVRQLLHRRQLILERRDLIIRRARERFAIYWNTKRDPGGGLVQGPQLTLSFVPLFPARQLCEQEELESHIAGCGLVWRQLRFTSDTAERVCQHESVLVLDAAKPYVQPFGFEANVWGLLFYGVVLQTSWPNDIAGVNISQVSGLVLLFIEHAKRMLDKLGYAGPILIETTLRSTVGTNWAHAWLGYPVSFQVALFGDEVWFGVESTTDDLREKRDGVAIELLRQLFLAVNLPSLVSPEGDSREDLIKHGYGYNRWKEPTVLRT